MTPTFETLKTVAAALDMHPTLLTKKHAWTWTLHQFLEWKLGLLWKEGVHGSHPALVPATQMVKVFLSPRPEHRYARSKLLKYVNRNGSELAGYTLEGEKWAREVAAANRADKNSKRGK